jgi:hypothetical protein
VIGAARVAEKLSPVWLLFELSAVCVRTVIAVPLGITAGAGLGGGADSVRSTLGLAAEADGVAGSDVAGVFVFSVLVVEA